MTRIDGRVAAVTGAGSGIGRALALRLADRSCRLALADVVPARLAEVADACRRRGAEVHAAEVDVADRHAVARWADEVVGRFGGVGLVFNNAGVAHHADVTEQDLDEIQRVLDVNLLGVVHGTQLFLPHLIASGDGHVVNVSSLFGLLPFPGHSAYCASKFGVRGYTEAVAADLRARRLPVRASSVHPGGVATNIARDATYAPGAAPDALRARFDRVAGTSADAAARTILRGVERDRVRILVGADARLLEPLARLLGAAVVRGAAWTARRLLPERPQPRDLPEASDAM